jgi:Zn-finger nucleic acid-binding protein
MSNACPRCGAPLSERSFGPIRLDGCSECGGLWFDAEELNKIAHDTSVGLMDVERAFNRAVSSEGEGGMMNCPKCGTALSPYIFPHTPDVTVDACQKCRGIWLDDDELRRISDRIATQNRQTLPVRSPYEMQREQARNVTGFLLSAPCPACKTTNPAKSLVCWACGAPLKARSTLRFCPRCDNPLHEMSFQQTPAKVDACRQCAGIWFEEGELPVFLRRGRETVEMIQKSLTQGRVPIQFEYARIARCPGCSHDMQAQPFGTSSLMMDKCPICESVWLDAGELVSLYDVAHQGGFAPDRAQSDPWGNA